MSQTAAQLFRKAQLFRDLGLPLCADALLRQAAELLIPLTPART